MKKRFLLLLLILPGALIADGISFESVTLDYYRSGLPDAVRVRVRNFTLEDTAFVGIVEETFNGYPESGTDRSEIFKPEEFSFYPGEWVLYFRYWQSLDISALDEGTTVIAVPIGPENEYLFMEDTPLNWRKVRLFVSDYQLGNWIKEQSKETLLPYLSDPDLAFPVYSYLKEQERVNEEDIITALRDYPTPLINFWSGTSLFHFYLQDLSPGQRARFLLHLSESLKADFHYNTAFFLSQYYYQDLKLYQIQNMVLMEAVFRERNRVPQREDFFYPLLSYQTLGVPLQEMLPLLGYWASINGDNEWEATQQYCLNIFFQQLKWEEKSEMLLYLGTLSKNRLFLANHRALTGFIENALTALPDDKRRFIEQQLEELNPVLYKQLQKH